MIPERVKRVGIIGAGIAGLATARTLLADGIDCIVFDRDTKLGGVWAKGYHEFGVQVQKELYEFPDFPLPENTPNFTPGPVFQAYMERYAQKFGIDKVLRLGTIVSQISRDGDAWSIEYAAGTETGTERVDFVVIATGLYSETPNIPELPGRDTFAGDIHHVYDLATVEPIEGRKVVVVGYGKSASDAAADAAEHGATAHMIVRTAHWPVPRKLAGLLPFKWGMLTRLTAAMIPPYIRPTPVVKHLHGIGYPLVWIFWHAVELLLRVQFRLDTPIEGGRSLLPQMPVESGCFGEATMVPRPGFMQLIRSGKLKVHLGTIENFEPTGVRLSDGTKIETDCVVFGTGWKNELPMLEPKLKAALGAEPDGIYLYRHILHPDVPGLAFLGRASTFMSVTTYSVQARWLAELLAGNVTLPSAEEMRHEIGALKTWKRAFMPSGTGRAARVLLHMAHYHDELLRDFGADPHRKIGLLKPFKEVFAPYTARDYRQIADGSWRSETA